MLLSRDQRYVGIFVYVFPEQDTLLQVEDATPHFAVSAETLYSCGASH